MQRADGGGVRLIVAAILVLFTIAYFAAALALARHTPPNSDEVFVMWILRTVSPDRLVEAMAAGTDSVPPSYFLLLRPFRTLFADDLFAIRVPSVGAFYLFLLSIFVIVRRHAGSAVALCAMALPCATGAMPAAPLGRPYAIVCACFGWALAVWDGTETRERRGAPLLALLLAGAIAVHFYATLLVVAFAAMEGAWTLRRRQVRWANWIAFTVGGATVFIWWSMITAVYQWTHTAAGAPDYSARPSLIALLLALQQLFLGIRLWLVILLASLLALAARVLSALPAVDACLSRLRDRPVDPARSDNLDLVALGALLLPLITFVFASLVTRVFNTRYFYAAVVALSVGAALALRRQPYRTAISLTVAAALTALLGLQYRQTGPQRNDRIDFLEPTPQSLPIVASGRGDFFTLSEAAPTSVRERLVFLLTPEGFQVPDPERMARAWKAFQPGLPVVEGREWIAQTPRFYVFHTGPDGEAVMRWLAAHAQLTVVKQQSGLWLFEAVVPPPRSESAAGVDHVELLPQVGDRARGLFRDRIDRPVAALLRDHVDVLRQHPENRRDEKEHHGHRQRQ